MFVVVVAVAVGFVTGEVVEALVAVATGGTLGTDEVGIEVDSAETTFPVAVGLSPSYA